MERVEVLLDEATVNKRIAEIGAQISKDFEGREVHLICVLKGGAPFMCELAKRITLPKVSGVLFMSLCRFPATEAVQNPQVWSK